MPSFRLAIDYGTSNTVAMLAWPDGRIRPLLFGGAPLLPSAVFAEADGRLLVGVDAVHAARTAPARFEATPKRRIDDLEVLLGERAYLVEDLIAATLRTVVAEAGRVAGALPADVVLTYPVAWGPARQQVLREAAARAGLPVPRLVTEPVAASIYFATVLQRRVPPGSAVVVYDLGAGTFDVSVVRAQPYGFDPLASGGLADVGGADLDQVVIEMAGEAVTARHTDPVAAQAWRRLTTPDNTADLRHRLTLRADARVAKEALSRRSSVSLLVPLVDRDIIIDREELERRIKPLLERTARTTLDTIREARVTNDRIAGLFLVGGCSRVPMVATILHRATGLAPIVLEQPELVVAEGALHAVTPAVDGRPAPPPQPVPQIPQPVPQMAQPVPQIPQPVPPPQPAPEEPASTAPAAGRSRRGVLLLGLGTGLAVAGGTTAWLVAQRGRAGASGLGAAAASSSPPTGSAAPPTGGPARKPGTLLWHQPVGSATSSPPLVVDGVVYAGSTDHHLYALDAATGQRRWRYRTGKPVFGGPVSAGGLVYGGSTDARVYALRPDGALVWSTATKGWPWNLFVAGDRVFASTSEGDAYALGTASGQVAWHAHVCNQANAITVADGVAYVSGYDHRLYAVRVGTTGPLWSVRTGDFINGAALAGAGVVYVASMDRKVYALSTGTGAVVWRRDLGRAMYGGPVLAGGRLFVGTSDGFAVAITAADGTVAWQVPVGKPVDAEVTVAGDTVYVATRLELLALAAADGKVRWRVTVGDSKRTSTSKPQVTGGVVYVGNGDGRIDSTVGELFAFTA